MCKQHCASQTLISHKSTVKHQNSCGCQHAEKHVIFFQHIHLARPPSKTLPENRSCASFPGKEGNKAAWIIVSWGIWGSTRGSQSAHFGPQSYLVVNFSFAQFDVDNVKMKGQARPGEGRARTGRGPGEDRARNGRGLARTAERRGVRGRGMKTLVFMKA